MNDTVTKSEGDAQKDNGETKPDVIADPASEKTEGEQEKKSDAETKSNTETASGESQEKKSSLSELCGAVDVLLMFYPKSKKYGSFTESIVQQDERTIYNLVKDKVNKKEELLISLDTSGGDVYAAVKIMDLLRSEYKTIKIAVMEEAKSSGTMMCLAADSVIMGPISELGPLDKPMTHPDNETYTISALDIVKSLDVIIDSAHDKQIDLVKKIKSTFGKIRQDQAVSLAGESVSGLVSPLLSRQDIVLYNQALRLLKMAEVYGKRYLLNHLGWITNEQLKEKIAQLVISKLIWEYPDHGFAICRDMAEDDLFLSIEKAEDAPYWTELWEKFESQLDTESKTIKFI